MSERDRLLAADLRAIVGIEHIGSTSVVGLPAKPVIDMLVGVASPAAHRPSVDHIAGILGYVEEGCRDGHAWMAWPDPSRRKFIAHIVVHGGDVWNARLTFRNSLRDSAELRSEYLHLKYALAAAYPHDLTSYTHGKRVFVDAVCRTRRGARSRFDVTVQHSTR